MMSSMQNRRRGNLFALGLLKFFGAVLLLTSPLAAQQKFDWSELPPLPNSIGVAGPFAGQIQGKLVVAGGANFPDRAPWEGGTKVWHDGIDVWDPEQQQWIAAGQLPHPLAYGVTIELDEGLLLIGGSDATQHHAEVWLLKLDSRQARLEPFEALPVAIANGCGARVGSRVFIAGGTIEPDSTSAERRVWMLDLAEAKPRWQEIEPMPGEGRMLAMAGVNDGAFFLFGGVSLAADTQGKPARTYLQSAYRYRAGSGWSSIADMPIPLAAAPSPALSVGPTHLLLVGGDDGSKVGFQPLTEHPGFNTGVWAYNAITDVWHQAAEIKQPRVTATTVAYEGGWVIPSGEIRPGVRSPGVIALKIRSTQTKFNLLDGVILGAYLLGVVALGSWFMFRNRTTDDYFRGGGRVPWWAAGISIFATMLSSITFMAIPAKAYQSSWSFYLANSYLILAPIIVSIYLPFFRRLNATSAYEYLELRFNLLIRRIASGLFVLLQLGRLAVVIFLPALTLSTATDFDIRACIAVMGLLVVVYSVLGGVEGVIWTDVIQTIVLLGGAVGALLAILFDLEGGVGEVIAVGHERQKFFESLRWDLDLTSDTVVVLVVGSIFANLFSYTASQDVVQRYVTTRDERSAARAIRTGVLIAPIAQAIFFTMGTALFLFYRQHPERLDMTRPIDGVFPQFIVDELPPGVSGLVIAAIFAAAQSTLSSTLNSVSAAVVTDFYRPWFPKATEASCLSVARWTTVLVGVVGTGVALVFTAFDVRSQWELFLSILGLFGGTVAGLFALGIFDSKANSRGALWGSMGSIALVGLLKFGTPVHYFVYPVAGVLGCMGIGTIMSRFLPTKDRDLTGLTLATLKDAEPSEA